MNSDDIMRFVALLPLEDEVQKFRERLEDCGCRCFGDLGKSSAFKWKKGRKPEEFVVTILKDEEII